MKRWMLLIGTILAFGLVSPMQAAAAARGDSFKIHDTDTLETYECNVLSYNSPASGPEYHLVCTNQSFDGFHYWSVTANWDATNSKWNYFLRTATAPNTTPEQTAALKRGLERVNPLGNPADATATWTNSIPAEIKARARGYAPFFRGQGGTTGTSAGYAGLKPRPNTASAISDLNSGFTGRPYPLPSWAWEYSPGVARPNVGAYGPKYLTDAARRSHVDSAYYVLFGFDLITPLTANSRTIGIDWGDGSPVETYPVFACEGCGLWPQPAGHWYPNAYNAAADVCGFGPVEVERRIRIFDTAAVGSTINGGVYAGAINEDAQGSSYYQIRYNAMPPTTGCYDPPPDTTS